MPTITKPKRKYRNDKRLNAEDRIKAYNSTRWRRLRRLKLTNDPLCEKCLEEGRVTPAEDVHHKISFMSVTDPVQRKFLAYDYENLQSLCKVCHQKIHNSNVEKVQVHNSRPLDEESRSDRRDDY